MCAAAYTGYEPAQGLLPMVFSYLETSIPHEIDQHLRDYLANAVYTGSLLAGEKLKCFDYQTFTDARHAFNTSGGFTRFYTHVEYRAVEVRSNGSIRSNRAMLAEHGHDWIHWFAIYASRQELLEYFDQGCEFDLRSKTSSGETALYLACARGCRDMAEELLKRGASPSVQSLHAFIGFSRSTKASKLKSLLGWSSMVQISTQFRRPTFPCITTHLRSHRVLHFIGPS